MILFGFIFNSFLFWVLFWFMGEKLYSARLSRLQGPEESSKSPVFFKAIPRMLLQQFFKFSLEPLEVKKLLGIPLRWQQFLVATHSLSLLCGMTLALLFSIFMPFGFYWGENLAKMAMDLTDYHWVFILSTNYLLGTLYGLTFSLVGRSVFRQTGVFYWLAIQGVLSGVMSLGFAWGLILGDWAMGFIFVLFKNRQSSDFCWRHSISLLLMVLFLIASPWLQNLVQIFWVEVGVSQLRLIHLLLMSSFFLIMDLGLNSIFFHFRWKYQNRI